MLTSLCRPDVLSSILLTFKLIRRGLLACLLATLLILFDRLFLVKGLSFPGGPFSLIGVSSCCAAYVVFPFLLFFMHSMHHVTEIKNRRGLRQNTIQAHSSFLGMGKMLKRLYRGPNRL